MDFEWPIFPDSAYSSRPTKDADADQHKGLLSLPLSQNINDWIADESAQFIANGMRQCVAAVILTHQHLQPRLLLFTSASTLDPSQHHDSSPDPDSNKSCTVHNASIPMFEYRKWQTPTEVLLEQLSKMVQIRPGSSVESFTEILGHSSIISRPPVVSQGPVPYLATDSENTELAESINGTPDIPDLRSDTTDDADLYSDLMSQTPTPAPQTIIKDEGKATTTYRPIVGSSLGIWWGVEFGHPPLPYLPAHVTRPKFQVRLFQVILPPDCEFVLPSDLRLNFVSFDALLDNSKVNLGPAYSSLPQAISRHSLRPMVSR